MLLASGGACFAAGRNLCSKYYRYNHAPSAVPVKVTCDS